MTMPENSPLPTGTPSGTPPAPAHRRFERADWIRTGVLFAAIALLHVVAFAILVMMVAPHHYTVGKQAFGVGLGVTAYTLGMRHAFDADHIAAIDNTTRKLMADGQRPVSVGFWFALGHSSIVVAMASLIAGGAKIAGTLVNEDSNAHVTLGVISTSVSGTFLYLIAALNLVALVGIYRVFKEMRAGNFDEHELEKHLDNRQGPGKVDHAARSRLMGRSVSRA